VRRSALSALAAIGGGEALEAVAFALSDEEPDVRVAAVRALGRLSGADGAPLGVERLVEVARTSTDPVLAAAAARALGGLSDARAIPALAELLGREPRVAVAAVESLGAFRRDDLGDVLSSALAHPDAEVVKAAMRALGSVRDEVTVRQLGLCLDHAEWDVRRLAAELLGTLAGDHAVALLRGRILLESQPLVREELARAITEAETLSGRRRTAPPPSLGGVRRE
jgi:HEAT repeat protein